MSIFKELKNLAVNVGAIAVNSTKVIAKKGNEKGSDLLSKVNTKLEEVNQKIKQ